MSNKIPQGAMTLDVSSINRKICKCDCQRGGDIGAITADHDTHFTAVPVATSHTSLLVIS